MGPGKAYHTRFIITDIIDIQRILLFRPIE